MAFFTQKVWVEWLEQALANGEYNYQDYKDLSDIEQIESSNVYKALMKKKDEEETMVSMKYIGNKLSTREVVSEVFNRSNFKGGEIFYQKYFFVTFISID